MSALYLVPGGADTHPHASRIVRPQRKPELPLIVRTALSVLIKSAPPEAHEAANTVDAYFRALNAGHPSVRLTDDEMRARDDRPTVQQQFDATIGYITDSLLPDDAGDCPVRGIPRPL